MSRTHPNNIDLGFNDLPFNQFEPNKLSERPKQRYIFGKIEEITNPIIFALIKQSNPKTVSFNSNVIIIYYGDFMKPIEIIGGFKE